MGMLCLGREVDQVIEIGPDITVKVLEIRHGRVKLGVTAPKDIGVYRREVADVIRAEKKRETSDRATALRIAGREVG